MQQLVLDSGVPKFDACLPDAVSRFKLFRERAAKRAQVVLLSLRISRKIQTFTS